MADTRYAAGTIKIKNANGKLVPFYPKTDSSVLMTSNGIPVSNALSEIEEQIEAAENSGGMDILYTSNVEEDSADAKNETLLVCFPLPEEDDFVFTVDTRLYDGYNGTVDDTNRYSGIPFNLYNQSAELDVDWGDGQTSHLTSSNYSSSSTSASTHRYSVAGIYTIRVKCSSWDSVYLFSMNESLLGSSRNFYSYMSFLQYYRRTLVSVDSPIPPVKGTGYWTNASSGSTATTFQDNSLQYSFAYCTKLKSTAAAMFSKCRHITSYIRAFQHCYSLECIADSTFRNCSNATTFQYCFYNCESLKEIADNAFWNCSKASSFLYCFYGCSSLNSLPRRLFYGCSSISTMQYTFRGCTSLKSIPSDLFKWCGDKLVSLEDCFYSCTSLTDIPVSLFKGCTALTDISYMFSDIGIGYGNSITIDLTDSPNIQSVSYVIDHWDGITLTVYVKNGTTTHSTLKYASMNYSNYDSRINVIAV